jgi:hypothetical protein
MLQRAASNAYSWWWASHIRTTQSKWLDANLQGTIFSPFFFSSSIFIHHPLPPNPILRCILTSLYPSFFFANLFPTEIAVIHELRFLVLQVSVTYQIPCLSCPKKGKKKY